VLLFEISAYSADGGCIETATEPCTEAPASPFAHLFDMASADPEFVALMLTLLSPDAAAEELIVR
jgi:hypothetical protein